MSYEHESSRPAACGLKATLRTGYVWPSSTLVGALGLRTSQTCSKQQCFRPNLQKQKLRGGAAMSEAGQAVRQLLNKHTWLYPLLNSRCGET